MTLVVARFKEKVFPEIQTPYPYGNEGEGYRIAPFSSVAKVVGVASFAFVLIGATTFALFVSGQFTTFPPTMVTLLTRVHPLYIATAFIGVGLWLGGGALVVARAYRQPENRLGFPLQPLLHKREGRVQILQCVEENPPATQEEKKSSPTVREEGVSCEAPPLPEQEGEKSSPEACQEEAPCEASLPAEAQPRFRWMLPLYVDRSTVPETHRPRTKDYAYAYRFKVCAEHYHVSVTVALAAIPYALFRMGYHLVWAALDSGRLVAALGRSVLGRKGEHTVRQCAQELGESLLDVVRSPFYGVALSFAAIYSLAKPMEGRILGAKIERDWNRGCLLQEGFWSVQGPQKACKSYHTPLFLAGCWQPVSLVEYGDREKETRVLSLGSAVTKGVSADSTYAGFYLWKPPETSPDLMISLSQKKG